MVTCDKCAESYADAVKFCPSDGTPLGATKAAMDKTPKVCSQCGAKYQGLKFCMHDGTLLEAAP
jgi:NADH pyrophosphatase NudC (nudix superfamily)